MRHGLSHIGALIAKGDRDFATDVDLQIESAIKASLATADGRPAVENLGHLGLQVELIDMSPRAVGLAAVGFGR